MAIDGKNKGNRFERELYHILKDKFGETNVKRSLGSGSTEEPADLMLEIPPLGLFYAIEAKHYKKLTWNNIEKFYKKLEKEVERKGYDNYIPILIFKQNYRDWEVVKRDVADGMLIRFRFKDWLRYHGV